MAAKETSPKRATPKGTQYDDPDARENYMINLAMNCVEQQMLEGKASPSVLVHYLKLGTKRAEIELEKMNMEKDMIRAKTEKLDAEKNNGELYANAIKAMGLYSGGLAVVDDEDSDI